MAYPTLSALTIRDDDMYVVSILTNDGGDSATDLGQLLSIEVDETYEDRQYKRVSTGNKRVPGDRATNVTLTIYVEDEPNEVARALGVMEPGGGWTTETISLNPDEVTQIVIQAWDGTGTSASKVHTWTLPNFSPRSMRTSISPDNPHTVQITGVSDAVVLDPNMSA